MDMQTILQHLSAIDFTSVDIGSALGLFEGIKNLNFEELLMFFKIKYVLIVLYPIAIMIGFIGKVIPIDKETFDAIMKIFSWFL